MDRRRNQVCRYSLRPVPHQQLRQAAHADAAYTDEVVGSDISHIKELWWAVPTLHF